MSFYTLRQYLKYRLKAKNRHGVHSPFVYAFVAHVMRKKQPMQPVSVQAKGFKLPAAWSDVTARIICYFNFSQIVMHAGDAYTKPTCVVNLAPAPTQDSPVLLCIDSAPGLWLDVFVHYRQAVAQQNVFLVFNIHQTQEHTQRWQLLSTQPEVTISIDLFYFGLLFFKKEVKQQQQFVLKMW